MKRARALLATVVARLRPPSLNNDSKQPRDFAPTPEAAQHGTARTFAAKIFTAALQAAPTDNVFLAPSCLEDALAMAWLGAREDTATQLAEALANGSEPAVYGARTKETRAKDAKAAGDAVLAVANRVWLEQNYQVDPSWLANIQGIYGSNKESVFSSADFMKSSAHENININAWISKVTNSKIPNLLPPNAVTSLTRLILTNAVFFKSSWLKPFPAHRSQPGTFLSPKGPIAIEMMSANQQHKLAKLPDGALIVELPYRGSQFVADVILPPAGLDIDAWSTATLERHLDALEQSLEIADLHITMPKFKIRTGGSIARQLQQLGITKAFGAGANFSGISPGTTDDLYISNVYHQVFIAVDESGTEAAGATAVELSSRAKPKATETFTVDRPFFFVIRNPQTGTIFFIGRILDPRGPC